MLQFEIVLKKKSLSKHLVYLSFYSFATGNRNSFIAIA